MQENEKCFILLKHDLLLHEKEFEALRNFMQNLDNQSNLKHDNRIDYSVEKDCITISPLMTDEEKNSIPEIIYSSVYANRRLDKVKSGYILLTVDSLKKILSL